MLCHFSRVRLSATLWIIASSVQGIFQARILEWVAMPSSRDLPNPGVKPASLMSPALAAAAAAKSHQSCPTLCSPIDGSPPGSPIPGILQEATLEWAAISFSSAWQWKVKVKSLSCVRLLATPWTVAHQAPLSMGFPRQEYWSGVPFSSLPALAGGFFTTSAAWEAQIKVTWNFEMSYTSCLILDNSL